MFKLFFPQWIKVNSPQQGQIVAPNEYFSWHHMCLMGLQHVVAMFGSTILAPMLMGFDPNIAILMSGIGTLIFFFVVGGNVPSYLGSSFAFIAVVGAATGYQFGSGINPNIAVALGGIIACGVLYTFIGFLVSSVGTQWIDKIMPPVVTGGVVAIIGLNLAPIAVKGASGNSFDIFIALFTIVLIGFVSVFTRGLMQRLMILLGMLLSYFTYYLLTNLLGWGGNPIDFSGVAKAAWFGIPTFTSPEFNLSSMTLIAPVALILVAENLGHVKAVSAMTGRHLDPYIGRAFIGDGLATVVSASMGGTGVTTYAENIGVMAATRIYSSIVFVIAACFAIFLGFSPKFGALIHTIPTAVLGGISIVVFGMIAVSGARIWVVNKVNFSEPRHLIVAAVTLILGAGNFTINFGNFVFEGIGTATFGAIILNFILNLAPKTEGDK